MAKYYTRKVLVEKVTIEKHFEGIFNPVNFKVIVRITTLFAGPGGIS